MASSTLLMGGGVDGGDQRTAPRPPPPPPPPVAAAGPSSSSRRPSQGEEGARATFPEAAAGREVDVEWIRSEIERTESSLDRLQRRHRVTEDHAGGMAVDDDGGMEEEAYASQRKLELERGGVGDPSAVLSRLRHLRTELDATVLAGQFASWEEERRGRKRPSSSLSVTEMRNRRSESVGDCSNLSSLLLQIPCGGDVDVGDGLKDLRRRVESRYDAIRRSTSVALRRHIRRTLAEVGYPSPEGCSTLDGWFSAAAASGEDADGGGAEFVSCCVDLISLQAVHERHLHLSSSSSVGGVGQHSSPPWRRMDLVDELCRPIVERVRYHFLPRQQRKGGDGNAESASMGAPPPPPPAPPSPAVESDIPKPHQGGAGMELCDRHDRLVEWMLSYLRETVLPGPLELTRRWVDPVVTKIVSGYEEENVDSSAAAVLPEATASRYLLREMVLLARHVLLGGGGGVGGGRGSKLLCTVLSDDSLFCRSMETMLRFDDYVLSEALRASSSTATVDGEGDEDEDASAWVALVERVMAAEDDVDGRVSAGLRDVLGVNPTLPRVSGLISSSDPDISRRWTDLESDNASRSFRSALRREEDEEKDDEDIISPAGMDGENCALRSIRPTLPPSTEALLGLLRSLHVKCTVAFHPSEDREYLVNFVNDVHVPLCMSYLDSTHGRVKGGLRDVLASTGRMLRPSTGGRMTWSTTRSTGGSSVEPAERLRRDVDGWCRLVGGINRVSSELRGQARYWEAADRAAATGVGGTSKTPSASPGGMIDRVGASLWRLADASTDEFASSLGEAIAVDDVDVASYLMRVHHLLQGDDVVGDAIGGHGEDSPSHAAVIEGGGFRPEDGEVTVSPELGGCIHALSVIAEALRPDEGVDGNEVASIKSIVLDKLSVDLASRLLDVAMDAPFVGRGIGGSAQFRADMRAVAGVFRPRQPGPTTAPPASEGGSGRNFVAPGPTPPSSGSTPTPTSTSPPPPPHPFDRLVDVVDLMAMDASRALALRRVLRDLVGGGGSSSGGGFGEHTMHPVGDGDDHVVDRYASGDASSFGVVDDRVAEEGRAMLLARGFASIDLVDAMTVLDRREM